MTPDDHDMPILVAPVAVSSLNGRKPRDILIEPDAALCAEVARYLNVTALRKFRFKGTLAPQGARDWNVSGHLGATVVQPCCVSLAPVTTRLDERVIRRYTPDWAEPEGDEVEMTIDETLEPLGAQIDLSAAVIEALALALPDFPRAADAVLTDEGVLRAAPEGQQPLTDDTVKPFAALSALRDKLNGPR